MTICILANVNALRGSPYICASLTAGSSRKRLKPFGSQNFLALESAASTANCGATSTAFTPGGCDLRWHQLPDQYVLGEVGAVAVKKHDHDCWTFMVALRSSNSVR